MSKFTICFVDEDESQCSIFYYAFKEEFNINIITPLRESGPESITEDILSYKPDLIIIDYRMREVIGFDGTEVVEEIRKRNKTFPVLIATSMVGEALDYTNDPNSTCNKAIWCNPQETESLELFKKRLVKLISIYQNKEIEITERLSMLQKKINENIPLTLEEEDEYISLNRFIEDISWGSAHTAGQLYSSDTNKRFDSLIEKTESLLLEFNDE